jgi:glycine dehydrogenase subunit 2
MMKKSKAVRCLKIAEPLLFEKSRKGRSGFEVPEDLFAGAGDGIPSDHLRGELTGLPEVTEPEAVRHYVRLSQFNFGVDTGLYPLGSCTMKYNPKINEHTASLPGFARIHPYLPDESVQGALGLMFELERYLAEISGMAGVTLQPAAGAHGEFTGIRIIRAALEKKGQKRHKVLIPDTAHGTNPASCSLNGYSVVEVKSSDRGELSAEQVAQVMDDDTAALMVTNPNTLGLFEEEIGKIARIVHERGGYMYGDGANLNALMGVARPGDMGFDVIQFNLHKTFSTPHGGGGPGSGPVGVCSELVPFLPIPRPVKTEQGFRLVADLPDSIGRVRAFFGNFLIMVRAYTYIRELGGEGLTQATRMAVLNANYVRALLRGLYDIPFDRICMHECVATDADFKKQKVSNVDVAKALIDRGFHPPTVSFPICVHGALMIEPTETETREELDRFVDALKEIREVAMTDPDQLHSAPHNTYISRLDEARAARDLILTADMHGKEP